MKYLTLWALLCILFGCGGTSQKEPPKKPSKIIFGYLQYEQLPEYQIPWDQLTHLSIAFGRATEEGGLADAANIEKLLPIFREGQKKGVKVLLSAGGGGNKAIMAGVLLNDTYRNRFKKELLKAVEDWGFDGLDIDYEHWTGGPEGYGEGDKEKVALLENFYKELRTELPKGKLLTAAVSADYPEWNGGWGNYNVYTNSMFEYLDLVNIMVYDFTGGWKSSKVAQHASMEHFRMAAKRWSEIRGVPKEKIILGVPFYGVHFVSAETPVGATHMPYKEILTNYPNEQATEKDEIGLLFYNGKPTMRAKAGYVNDNGYEPSLSVETYYANTEDAIYEKIKSIALDRLVGDDCKSKYLEVLIDKTEGPYDAWMEDCIVKPQSYGGPQGGVNIPFNIQPCGNRIKGTVTIANKVVTFTPLAEG